MSHTTEPHHHTGSHESRAHPAPSTPETPEPGTAPDGTTADDTLWTPAAVGGFRDRWREVQLRFVDDPSAATDQAEALVAEALDDLSAAAAARKKELGSWHGEGGDTEQMRTVVRRYRTLLDRLLTL